MKRSTSVKRFGENPIAMLITFVGMNSDRYPFDKNGIPADGAVVALSTTDTVEMSYGRFVGGKLENVSGRIARRMIVAPPDRFRCIVVRINEQAFVFARDPVPEAEVLGLLGYLVDAHPVRTMLAELGIVRVTDLDALEMDDLRELAQSVGVKIAPAAKAPFMRKAIAEAGGLP